MSSKNACPNCGSNEIFEGRVIGQLDLGGGLGFRPDRTGWFSALFKVDLPLAKGWSGCAHCGMIWSFTDAARLARTVGSSNQTPDPVQSGEEARVPRGTLIWNQGAFVPLLVRRRRTARRVLMRCTVAIILIVGSFAMYSIKVQRRVPPWLGALCVATAVLILALWTWELIATRRLRWWVTRHGASICPQCNHVLSPTEGVARCPECGVKYDPAELPKVWGETRAAR
ncbi:MAG: hypothetical protein KF724_12990 [Phycisphaeraceae bacterium]|nr:hypothetical protein [Phycisphaeraceae bacterium]